MGKSEKLIEIKGVSKSLSGKVVLDDINLSLASGKFVSLVGKSGSGKTTILKVLAGLVPVDDGELIYGKSMDSGVSRVGFVFQKPTLLPWRTVVGNLNLPEEIVKQQIDNKRTEELISLVGLKGYENYYPNQLSGGMQQRVGIARALKTFPKVLLMDEPFSALDEINRNEMTLELLRIWRLTKDRVDSVLYVTHSLSEAVFLSDEILVLSSKSKNIKARVKVNIKRPRDKGIYYTSKFNQILKKVRNLLE